MCPPFDILLIEDEPVIVDAAKKILSSEGLTVDEAFDADTARAKLQQNRYDLIVSDLMLPNVSGLVLLEDVKKQDPAVPVIMITGYATLESAIRSFKLGAFDFIPKPFDAAELLGVIRRGLGHKRAKVSSEVHGRSISESPDFTEGTTGDYYFLGHHSWAKLAAEGFITVGVGETFPQKMGKIERLEFPTMDADLLQGNLCVRILAADGVSHMVWAPLSGRVVKVNQEVEQNANLINTDPLRRGWLVKILPANLVQELQNLTIG